MSKCLVNSAILSPRDRRIAASRTGSVAKALVLENPQLLNSCVNAHTISHMEATMIRTQRQAMAEATRRFGNRAAVRDAGRMPGGRPWPSPAERAAASDELRAVLAAPEPRNADEIRARKRRVDELRSITYPRRFAVGYIMPYLGAFCVQGQGDTWDEAFAAVRR